MLWYHDIILRSKRRKKQNILVCNTRRYYSAHLMHRFQNIPIIRIVYIKWNSYAVNTSSLRHDLIGNKNKSNEIIIHTHTRIQYTYGGYIYIYTRTIQYRYNWKHYARSVLRLCEHCVHRHTWFLYKLIVWTL